MTHPKISPELIARAAALSTPELCDGMEPFRAMHYEIKPLVGDRVVGQSRFFHTGRRKGGSR